MPDIKRWCNYQRLSQKVNAMGEEATWSKTSVVRGYITVWTLYIGQSLQLCCEDDNELDDHAVYVRCSICPPRKFSYNYVIMYLVFC